MTPERITKLKAISWEIEEVFSDLVQRLERLASLIGDIKDEEQVDADRLSEGDQEGDVGAKAEEIMDHLDEAVSALDGLCMSSDAEEATKHIDAATS